MPSYQYCQPFEIQMLCLLINTVNHLKYRWIMPSYQYCQPFWIQMLCLLINTVNHLKYRCYAFLSILSTIWNTDVMPSYQYCQRFWIQMLCHLINTVNHLKYRCYAFMIFKSSLAVFWLSQGRFEEIEMNSKYVFFFFLSGKFVIENQITFVQEVEMHDNICVLLL